MGGVGHAVGGYDVQAAFSQDFLAAGDVGSFQSYDQRYLEGDLLGGFDYAGGDDVAFHDAAEDVDQDPFDVFVGEDQLEGFGDALNGGSAPDIQEVGRVAAVMLDDVHGGHGQSGSVDQAADVAVERDVGEVMLGCFDFVGVFFVVVAHVAQFGVAEDGVVVKAEFGVEADQVFFGGDYQRVDFQHGAVAGDEGFVESPQYRDGFVDQFAPQTEAEGDLAALEGGQADQRVNGFGEDLFGGFGGDFFDVHPPFGGGHDGDFGCAAVHYQRDVQFGGDVAAVFDQDAGDQLSFRSGLVGAEGHAEHLAGDQSHFVGGAGQFDAAPFAAAAGMNLGLDDPRPLTKALGPFAGAGAVVADVAVGDRHAEFS